MRLLVTRPLPDPVMQAARARFEVTARDRYRLDVLRGLPPGPYTITVELSGLSTFTLIDADLNSFVWLSRFAALYYFAYFLVVLPVLGLTETPLPQPESISAPVLSHPANAPAGAAASPEKRG